MNRATRALTRQARLLRASYSASESKKGDLFPLQPCMFQQLRGAKVLGSDVREGNVVERKGRMMEVLKTQHTQQGRGGAIIQAELRDIQSGLKSTERFRTSEAIEKIFCESKSFTYLYTEGNTIFLMEPKTFEQVEVSKSMLGNGAAYLADGMSVTLQFADNKVLSAAVPQRVTCKVVEAEPSYKGQTATPTTQSKESSTHRFKKVLLENGLQIGVPTFVNAEDMVVVDTTDNSYVTRSKS